MPAPPSLVPMVFSTWGRGWAPSPKITRSQFLPAMQANNNTERFDRCSEDGRRKRIEKGAFLKENVLVRTGPRQTGTYFYATMASAFPC